MILISFGRKYYHLFLRLLRFVLIPRYSMSTKPASLIYWMLLHIHTDPTLLTQLRAEIAPFVLTTQPPQILSIPSPPRLSIDLFALVNSCPLLKSCLFETLRLYTTPNPTLFVTKDTALHDPEGKLRSHQDYILDQGSYITAPLTLHHHNPAYFWQPNEFYPRRFLKARENTTPTEHPTHPNEEHTTWPPPKFDHPSNLHAFGIGHSVCPARYHAEAEILAFIAAILSLWDFEPANSKGWIIPGRIEREIVCVPKRDLRVLVRAREFRSS